MRYLILFDIDGTILKLKTYYSREIFSKVLREIFDIDISNIDLPSFKGKTDLSVLKYISEIFRIEFSLFEGKIDMIWNKLLDLFKEYYKPENFDLINGISEFLQNLSKNTDFVLGLQTGNFKDNAFAKLKVFGFDKYFKIGAFGSDFEDRNLLPTLAIKRANEFFKNEVFDEKNTLVIGDSISDIICAKSNNLPIILVNSDKSFIEDKYLRQVDLVINDFSNREKIIDSFYKILN